MKWWEGLVNVQRTLSQYLPEKNNQDKHPINRSTLNGMDISPTSNWPVIVIRENQIPLENKLFQASPCLYLNSEILCWANQSIWGKPPVQSQAEKPGPVSDGVCRGQNISHEISITFFVSCLNHFVLFLNHKFS